MNVYKFNPKTLKFPITLIYDGSNNRWAKEAVGLKDKNKDGKLTMVDGSAAGADLAGLGLDAAKLKGQIFARDAAGTLVSGVDAVFAAHEALGFGSWFSLYRAPGFFFTGYGVAPH